ncbi:phage tail tape measure C-terminal domain-containing protein [Enterobacter hormaechei]
MAAYDAGYKKNWRLSGILCRRGQITGDWKAGAVAGWNDTDAATNTDRCREERRQFHPDGLSNMLTELMTTGTASVKEFGKSMLKMILEITNQLIVAYTVQAEWAG